jgi:imidazolonepropionase-like amidohydrolase
VILRLLASLAAGVAPAASRGQDPPVVLRAARMLDGRGGMTANADILVRDGRIVRVGPRGAVPAGARLVDLGVRTAMPGFIDAHTHPTWYFNRQGRLHTRDDGEGPAQSALAAAANAYATLRAGFTTIQSLGAREDADLQAWFAARGLPGPRILTSLDPLTERSGDPDSLRALVRRHKAEGADVIKLFASATIREGGAQTMTDAQLAAACGEAKALGLRVVVHAHSAAAVRAAVLAGCTQVEHGLFVTQEVLDLMAARGTYFDPQCGLVFRNYLENRAKYEGIGNYTEAGFRAMERSIPLALGVMRRALATPGLKVLYGTDAVAGADGRNGEDLVCRVTEAGDAPMQALVAATSLNATALGWGDRIGAIAPQFEADIVALDSDPTTDITAVRRVSFVMIGGRIVRDDGAPGPAAPAPAPPP